MAISLYFEAMRRHLSENPHYLEELDETLGHALKRCPDCDSPMLPFSTRWRQMYMECICPIHGLVIVDIEEVKGDSLAV